MLWNQGPSSRTRRSIAARSTRGAVIVIGCSRSWRAPPHWRGAGRPRGASCPAAGLQQLERVAVAVERADVDVGLARPHATRLAALGELGVDERAEILVARGRARRHSACSSCRTRARHLQAPQIQREPASWRFTWISRTRPVRRRSTTASNSSGRSTGNRRNESTSSSSARRPSSGNQIVSGRPISDALVRVDQRHRAEDRVAQARRPRLHDVRDRGAADVRRRSSAGCPTCRRDDEAELVRPAG